MVTTPTTNFQNLFILYNPLSGFAELVVTATRPRSPRPRDVPNCARRDVQDLRPAPPPPTPSPRQDSEGSVSCDPRSSRPSFRLPPLFLALRDRGSSRTSFRLPHLFLALRDRGNTNPISPPPPPRPPRRPTLRSCRAQEANPEVNPYSYHNSRWTHMMERGLVANTRRRFGLVERPDRPAWL